MQVIPIHSLDDPRLALYANLRDAELRHRMDPACPVAGEPGFFMAEGELVVRRLIESPFPVDSVLLTPTRLEGLRDALAGLPAGTPSYVADQALLNQVVGFNMHRGLLAVGRRITPTAPGDLIARSRVLLVLEDLVNHDNLGAVFRNAAALGGPGTGILLSPRCADPLYRKSLRVSMGHVLGVPFATAAGWPDALGDLRRAGYRVLALSPGPGARDIGEVAASPPARIALLVGTEGAGLTAAARANADELVRIPMAAGVDSLNVAVAAAIGLHRLVVVAAGTKPALRTSGDE